MIETNDIGDTRRVIDIFGDGPNNWSGRIDLVCNAIVKKQITISGLPIMNDRGQFVSRDYLPNLEKYYLGCVIGGSVHFSLPSMIPKIPPAPVAAN